MKGLRYTLLLLLLLPMGGLIAAYATNTNSKEEKTDNTMRSTSDYVIALAHTLTL